MHNTAQPIRITGTVMSPTVNVSPHAVEQSICIKMNNFFN